MVSAFSDNANFSNINNIMGVICYRFNINNLY